MRHLRIRLLPLLLVSVATVGCASKGPPPTIVDAVAAYRGGQYDTAYEQSVKLADSPGGTDQATYMAGMSAFRLGKEEEALRHLGKLTAHKDDTIAGPANATIGLVMAKRGNHDRALNYYAMAVPRLKGNDQAQAYFHMAVTEQKLGKWAQARPHLVLAAANATDPNLKAAAQHRIQTAGFTLQFGAHRIQQGAQQQAREVSRLSERAGIGPARVVALDHGGRTLYHVQAGAFSAHEQALNAKKRLSRADVIVVKLPAEN